MSPTSEYFAAFYQLYPRHVARKSAEKAWMRVAAAAISESGAKDAN